jgi:hypothetical protein
VRFEATEVALAGAGAGEERDRLALQVREDVRAQPVHDLLADPRGDPRLHDAQRRGHGRDGDHAGDEPEQQGQVLPRQGVVDHGPEQERRGHGDDGRDDDQGGHRGDGPAVRGEQPGDPTERDLAGLRLLGGGDGARAATRLADGIGLQGAPFDKNVEVTST